MYVRYFHQNFKKFSSSRPNNLIRVRHVKLCEWNKTPKNLGQGWDPPLSSSGAPHNKYVTIKAKMFLRFHSF